MVTSKFSGTYIKIKSITQSIKQSEDTDSEDTDANVTFFVCLFVFKSKFTFIYNRHCFFIFSQRIRTQADSLFSVSTE